VAFEVREFVFGEFGAAVDAVHDLERARRVAVAGADVAGHELHERLRLAGEAEAEQGVDAEGGVADPDVAVVPVALAAELFGEAGGGGGDDGAGGGVGQEFEGEGGAVDHLAPAAPVAGLGDPAPPVGDRRGELVLGLLAGAGAGGHLAVDLVEGEHLGLALVELEVGPHVDLVALQGDGGGQREGLLGGLEEGHVADHPRGVRAGAVVEPRGDLGPERDRAAHAQHAADQAVPGGRVRFTGHRHEVLDLADALLGVEPGDQDVGVGEVELLGARGHGGGELEGAAAFRVQDRGEDAGGVEGRAAVPVDRAVGAHQRHAPQIADQSVLGDGQISGSGGGVLVGRGLDHRGSLPGSGPRGPVPSLGSGSRSATLPDAHWSRAGNRGSGTHGTCPVPGRKHHVDSATR
jgi:hypothetical protein